MKKEKKSKEKKNMLSPSYRHILKKKPWPHIEIWEKALF